MTTLVDAVIALTLFEGLALAAFHRSTGRGPAPRDVMLNLVSGLCLMLALAGVLREAGIGWLMLCLAGAGAAHGSDLWLKARRGQVAPAEASRNIARPKGNR